MSELINNQSKKRQEKLKKLIKRLHQGEPFETVKSAFEAEFSDVSTAEISQMEQALIEEGMPVEEIQRLCSVHAAVFNQSISDLHASDLSETPGHPLHVLKDENARIQTLLNEEIKPFLNAEGNMPILMIRIGLDRLQEIDKHFTRKEQLFFPYLEKKNIKGPSQVMWGVDDEIRKMIKDLKHTLNQPDTKVSDVKESMNHLIEEVEAMIMKENTILIPLLSENLNLYNFIKIDEASDEIGFFLEAPKARFNQEHTEETNEIEQTGEVRFDAGSLSPYVLNAMLNTLPLDMTFVDKDGYVKYFTQGKERTFDRPKTILGRHVNMCHPPKSVHIVEKIVENFKSGKKDNEDFWINMRGKMIHIRYFAVRGKDNEYLGTLEMTQEIQEIRDLEGEKRLVSDD